MILGFVLIALYIIKLFAIIVQDQWLIMTSGYFKKIFPETAENAFRSGKRDIPKDECCLR